MIIPAYDTNFEIENGALEHSYQIQPPGYSTPQILYSYYYKGFITSIAGPKTYIWTVDPPFYIVSGQTTINITLELRPQLNINQETIVGEGKTKHRDYKYCKLNLQIEHWSEYRELYYQQGPIWKITGNKFPKTGTTETYTLTPKYDQTGYPPKNSTDFNFYSFDVKNGKVMKFHGGVPPYGIPLVDIYWYQAGTSYLSFYSSWKNEAIKFPNTLDILVSNQ